MQVKTQVRAGFLDLIALPELGAQLSLVADPLALVADILAAIDVGPLEALSAEAVGDEIQTPSLMDLDASALVETLEFDVQL
jgi:hypothetical protein